MQLFRNISLQRKQTLILMLAGCLPLLLASTALVGYEQWQRRAHMVEDMATQAAIVGNNCSGALDFQDVKAATEILAGFRANPNVVFAVLYTPSDHVFATYRRADVPESFQAPPVGLDVNHFEKGRLTLFRRIERQGEKLGTVALQHDLEPITRSLRTYLGITSVVLVLSVLAAYLISSQLQRLISRPIMQLAQTARTVALDKNYAVRVPKHGRDELGILADDFNDMLANIQARDTMLQQAHDELEHRVQQRTAELSAEIIEHKRSQTALDDAQRLLIDASREAGMADVATNVLHNVGNVLNSVNVSAAVLLESLRKSKVANLTKVVVLLREHEANPAEFLTTDPRGRQLPDYLISLAQYLAEEREVMLKELGSLIKNIEHIKDIVAMQQNYAHATGVKALVSLRDLVEDALQLNCAALIRHDVQIVREYQETPRVLVEKHRLVQILVNVIRNAKYALDEGAPPEKRVTLRINGDRDHGVRIEVADNGCGITPEVMPHIFEHGFTTRAGGHGFGLHGSILAAKQLGGSLKVHSDGRGQGATFILELPCDSDTEEKENNDNRQPKL